MLINPGYNAIDLLILTWVDFKSSLFKRKKKKDEKEKKKNLAFYSDWI